MSKELRELSRMETNKIYNEPCLDTISRMPDNYLDCVITSPPYWQLRDYGWSGQWGLESTFEEYLENLWSMMDALMPKLKDEGTIWVNIGDTYSGSGNGTGDKWALERINGKAHNGHKNKSGKIKSIQNKCQLMIPHRFAIGCIERGWIVRNDIIWAKRNGMPESVNDRFSKKHEYFFLIVKQPKYYFDLDSIRDKHNRYKYSENKNFKGNRQNNKHTGVNKSGTHSTEGNSKGKNPGSVSSFWDIPTKKNKQNHYAQYSDSLIKKPILAGCPKGGIIYDPFMGSGSTAEAAFRAGRKFIGSEGSKEYFDDSQKRLKPFLAQNNLFV